MAGTPPRAERAPEAGTTPGAEKWSQNQSGAFITTVLLDAR